MAKVFLDTNCFIGLSNKIPKINSNLLDTYQGFISTLSIHILYYVNKIKVPDRKTNLFIEDFNTINLDEKIIEKSLSGPTNDFEGNIQLHSAAEANSDLFLTFDKTLLKMKFFGKTRIISPEYLKKAK